jgi:nucleoid-associated protein YgaU
VNVISIGEVNLLGKRNLKTISLASFFPNQNYDFCQYSDFPKPQECIKIIEEMKNSGVLRLIMTGTPIKMNCTIEGFTWGENDGTKDIHFTIELKEYRNIDLNSNQSNSVNKDGSKISTLSTKRTTKAVKSTTYTVKNNDTLCTIAKRMTGSSSNYIAIANQNNITNPSKIYVGQKLVIKV